MASLKHLAPAMLVLALLGDEFEISVKISGDCSLIFSRWVDKTLIFFKPVLRKKIVKFVLPLHKPFVTGCLAYFYTVLQQRAFVQAQPGASKNNGTKAAEEVTQGTH